MNKVEKFYDKITKKSMDYYVDDDNTIWFNAEEIARGLGFVHKENKKGKEYISIRWETINRYLVELGFRQEVGENNYIPEQYVNLLAMKAKSDIAKEFQRWLAFDVIPSIRKHGIYIDKDHDKIRSFGINVRLVECKAIQYLIYYARDNYGMDISEDEAYGILSVYANKIAEIPIGKEEREKAESIKLAVCSYVEGIITAIIYHMIKNKEHPRTILDKTIQIAGEILYKIREMSSERRKKEKEKKAKTKELAASKIKKLRKARKKSSFEVFNVF